MLAHRIGCIRRLLLSTYSKNDIFQNSSPVIREGERENFPLEKRNRKDKNEKKDDQRREDFCKVLGEEFGEDEQEGFSYDGPMDKKTAENKINSDVRRRENAKQFDMARRKYYDFPVEDNLLTYRAKEQIFDLYENAPDVWTPEKIADSFPISVEAARRLLKSKWPPDDLSNDENKKLEHDELVRRRWIILKRGKTEENLVSEITLRMIRTGQVKCLPMYALGNSKLKNSDEKTLATRDETATRTAHTPHGTIADGPFSRLYQKHLASVRAREDEKSDSAPENNSGSSEKNAEFLRAYVFPEENDETKKNTPLPFVLYKKHLKKQLDKSERPEDKQYRDWMKTKKMWD